MIHGSVFCPSYQSHDGSLMVVVVVVVELKSPLLT